MKVLVTGGAGYIGSHTCRALALQGHEPLVLDNLLYGHEEAVQWGPFEKGDILGDLKPLFASFQPEAVIHFAGLTYVGESAEKPLVYYQNNVVGALNVIKTIVSTRSIPFIFSSTCAVYGNPHYLPLDEEHPQEPISPYGRSKMMVEEILRDARKAHGLRYAILRYFNAGGAAGVIGEDHTPETHLIPLAIEAALLQKPLKLFGSDYDTPDGSAIRDYVHVVDLADAHVKALHVKDFMEVNLGSGRGYSVKEVVQMVEKVTGRRINVEITARRPGDPPRLVASTAKAEKVLGWKAGKGLEEIIQTAYLWHKKQYS